jgi:O-antigen/teichoic acid export membrane protein
MAMMALSQPMINALFQNKYVNAPLFLTLYIIGNLFAALGTPSATSLLSGLGDTRIQVNLNILKLVLGIPLGLLLIPHFEILGLIASYILSGVPSFFWRLYWIWKKYKVKANYDSLLRLFSASAVAAASSFLFLSFFNLTSWIGLIIGGSVFISCYLFALPMLRGVDEMEVQNLKAMFSGLGLITRLLSIPLNLLQRFLEFQRAYSKRDSATR